MPSPDAGAAPANAPLAPLVANEIRRACASCALWLGAAAAGPVSALAMRRALGSPVSDVVAAAFMAAGAVALVFIPFVSAQLAADRDSELALRQLGHRTLGIVVARLIALGLAVDALLVPVVAVALTTPSATLALAASGTLGAALVGLALAGATMLAGALLARESAAAAALAVAVAGIVSVLVVLRELPGAFAMPSAALALFAHGLVEARDIASLAAGAAGLALAGGALSSTTAPPERRAVRAGILIVATLMVCGASSQLRLSWDATPSREWSLPPATATALAQVGDPVVVTVRMAPGDARWPALRDEALTPLSRVVKLRVKRAGAGGGADVDIAVGGQTRPASTLRTRADFARTVLELAGLAVPADVDARPPPAPPVERVPLAWPIALSASALALVALWRARR